LTSDPLSWNRLIRFSLCLKLNGQTAEGSRATIAGFRALIFACKASAARCRDFELKMLVDADGATGASKMPESVGARRTAIDVTNLRQRIKARSRPPKADQSGQVPSLAFALLLFFDDPVKIGVSPYA
jgi:hypothetical protein